jgi:hypothetical protein
MKECKRLKCPKNKGLQGFVRVRKRAKALPDNEEFGEIKLLNISMLRNIMTMWNQTI